MIKKTRGGIYCLLFFFLLNKNYSQELLVIPDLEVKSETYGQIALEGLDTQTLNELSELNLSYAQWSSFFFTKVEGSSRAVLGNYSISESQVIFKPRFLPDTEVKYVIVFSASELNLILPNYHGDEKAWPLAFSKEIGAGSQVVSISPDTETLPENILRLYIYFSRPMSFANPYKHLSLVDEAGNEIPDAFVEIEEGLWNQDRTRLTVLFHPGRIKRGVGPNLTQGQIFKKGKKYTLLVSSEWKSASGKQMEANFSKKFNISKSIRNRISVESWEISSPHSGTQDPIKIKLREALDLPIARRTIDFYDSNGDEVSGRMELSAGLLIFTPFNEWTAGTFSIRVNPKLEDVCGNSPLAVFDLETSGKKNESVILPDLIFKVN